MKNIFVGNLSYDSTEESVRALFEPYGVVNSARIMTDRETGRSRGFAFVEMANEAEAEQAIQALNGYKMEGRALNVNEARPKPERSFGVGPKFGEGGGRGRSAGAGRREPRW
jgi:RNA recognition motif-containing protein